MKELYNLFYKFNEEGFDNLQKILINYKTGKYHEDLIVRRINTALGFVYAIKG